ncbi:HamA C-terminal domain-containing protein [Nocardioides okcheonensis]|uniref:HamA C-terminal domain-containing protein n=1 Tax=Nocardioides okcheonensis TaxID=2894081 RepID=UPI001E4B9C32|nr:DUF1837 domain-containing protein [Nocardioides okcheonensis]UFN43280.1 DUF1837 domain-containing protein [Nocardioides okcheonensis]
MSEIPERLREQGVDEWLVDAVDAMARGRPENLAGLLVAVGEPVVHEGTRTTCRTHFVVKDGNGRPRIEKLADRLAQKAVDYCIPRSRINDALTEMLETGSAAGFTRLSDEARSLFTKLSKSGEGGELLLYTLLEVVLRIPQILCKMPLKTSSQMHVHGSDGIHGKVLPNGNLALYWGESKLHATPKSAIDSCFESIAPFLAEGMDGAAKRDLYLIRDNLDAGAEEVTAALIRYFGDETEESAKVEVRAGCLVGFDLGDYPNPFDESGEAVSAAAQEAIDAWHERIKERVTNHELVSFEMEVFCVPVPSVESFRDALRQRLELK